MGRRWGNGNNWQQVNNGKKGKPANKQPQGKAWGSPGATLARNATASGAAAPPTSKQLAEWKARGWQDRTTTTRPTDPSAPVIPPVDRGPEQTARTNRLWHQHQEAIKVCAIVTKSGTATPEVVAMHENIVATLRAQLDESKPREDIYAGQLKKIEQTRAKLLQGEAINTKEYAALDAQHEVCKQSDERQKALRQHLLELEAELPAMAQAAKATLPKPRHEQAVDDLLQYAEVKISSLAGNKDATNTAAVKGLQDAMAGIHKLLEALTVASVTTASNQPHTKDAEGDDIMGNAAKPAPPNATTDDQTAHTQHAKPPEATQENAQGKGNNSDNTSSNTADPPEPRGAPPTPEAAQQTTVGADGKSQDQEKILATAQEVSVNQDGDSDELKTQRSALRGRMVRTPIDYDALQACIAKVQATIQIPAHPPAHKSQRTTKDPVEQVDHEDEL